LDGLGLSRWLDVDLSFPGDERVAASAKRENPCVELEIVLDAAVSRILHLLTTQKGDLA
jgi:hypothetical protein